MAKKAIKGITVEIGGDTVGLQKALGDVNKKSSELSFELRQVNNALKFDPANTTLLAQKQQILSEQVKNTSDKLQQLRSVQSQVEQQFQRGKIGADAYRAFQRELVNTDSRLQSLQSEETQLNTKTENTSRIFETLKDIAAKTGKALLSSVGTAFSALGTAAADVTKALVNVYTEMGKMAVQAVKAATSVGSEFESSMSQVAATMGTTVDSISGLKEKAKDLGATTQFSATEAAQGLNILAMSGLSAEEQTAAIGNVLNLAAAGSLDLANAASYITGAVKGFGDSMENAQYYTDLMAKGATLANTDVNGLGAALSRSAATANSYSLKADGVTLSLLRLAEQNVTGEEAATSLNRAMADLYTPTDNAKAALEELGIAAYDNQGNTRDFNEVVDELNSKLSTMTAEQANAYKSTIFTTNGLSAFNKMTSSSTEKVEKFRKELADANGSAEQQAKTMIDNLKGDITLLQSATSGLGIEFYDTFNKDLRNTVQFATDGVGQLTDAFKNGGLSEAADVAGEIIADIATKAADYAPTLIDTATTLINSVATALVENSPSIALSAGELAVSIADGLTSNTETILGAVLSIGDNILNTLPNILQSLVSSASSFAKSIIDFISKGISIVTQNLPQIISTLSESLFAELPTITRSIFDLITNTVDSVLPILPDILNEIINLAIELIMEFLPQIIDTVVKIAESIVDNLPSIVDTLANAIPDIIHGVLIAVLNQIPKLIEGVFKIVSAITEALPQIIDSLVEMLPEIINAIIMAIAIFLPKIVETGITLFTAIIKDLPRIINSIVGKLPEIIDSIINALLDALPLLIDCGVDLFLALIEALPEIIGGIVDALPQIVEGVIDALLKCLPDIIECGIELFIAIVQDVPEIIKGICKHLPEIITGIVEGFEKLMDSIAEIGTHLAEGIWDGILGARDWLVENVTGWCDDLWGAFTDFFGIHSPSTLFRDTIGNNLALGIGEGFVDTMADVTNDMQDSLPTAFDIDPSVNLVSGDSRMQVVPQTFGGSIVSDSGNTYSDGGEVSAINFTLRIDNFNNTVNTSIDTLSQTIENALYEFIKRNKLAVR